MSETPVSKPAESPSSSPVPAPTWKWATDRIATETPQNPQMAASPAEAYGLVTFPDKSKVPVRMTIPTRLTPNNFTIWDKRFTSILKSYGAEDALKNSSSEWNDLVKLALENSMSDEIYPYIMEAYDAKTAYETLTKRFGEKASGNLQNLLVQYRTFKVPPTETIGQAHARFVQLVSTIRAAGVTLDETDQGAVFLFALPEEFKQAREVMLMTKYSKLDDVVTTMTRAQAAITTAQALEENATERGKVLYNNEFVLPTVADSFAAIKLRY